MGAPEVAVAFVAASVAAVGTIGADARWPAALGKAIVNRGAVPHGVPYASAPSADWPNVPVLAELILHWLSAAFGDRGLLVAQVIAVAGGLAFAAADMRRSEASELGSALALFLIGLGAAPSLGVIRVQLFSYLLFPALAFLLRSEMRSPSRRIWLVPAVLAPWSNVHGAVLVGLAVAASYLVFRRAREDPFQASTVLVVSVLAVCATPALERTPAYYVGVLRNEAARRGEGLWAPLSLNSGFDQLLLATGIVLVVLALWRRPPLWEVIAMAALAIVTVRTARSGVWLLLFAAPPAASAIRLRPRLLRPWPVIFAVAASLFAVYGVARGPHTTRISRTLIDETLQRAHGTPVLADGPFAEQLAFAGARVWMSNPLDAFPARDQRLYLDWLDGRPAGLGAFAHAPRAVLVRRDGPPDHIAATMDDFRVVARDRYGVLYVRRS
jgi:hypothetical protein